jgi:outer membrane receptor for ferrienterochelin and colicins
VPRRPFIVPRLVPWIVRGTAVLVSPLSAATANAQSHTPAPPPACPEGTRPSPSGCAPVEIVVLGTRTPESSQRATVRTEVVTREEAERRGARNVAEALGGELSLQVNPQAYGYLGNPSGLQMQGFDADRVLVLEDGERVVGDSAGVTDLSELPLTDVDRIEYVTGPTSSLYGSDALGGVVNVVTAPPREPGVSGRSRVEARSSGDTRLEASSALRGGQHWVALDGSLDHGAPLELDGGPVLVIPRHRRTLLGARAGTRFSRRAELRLKLRWLRDTSENVSVEERQNLAPFVSDVLRTSDRVTARVTETLTFAGGSRVDFSLGRSFFFHRSEVNRKSSPTGERRKRESALQSLEGVATIADGEQRTWVIGVRSESESFSEKLAADEYTAGRFETEVSYQVPPSSISSGALFAQLGYRVLDELSLMPGLRGEFHDRYGSVLVPRLALALRPTTRVTLRASFGRGFRAPSATEYGFVLDHSALTYRVLGNPELVPEKSWGVNTDLTWRPGPRVRLRVGAFGNWVDDLIGTEAMGITNGVRDFRYVNVARARTAGGDVSVTFDPLDALTMSAGYAYLFTRDDSSGQPLPSRPPHTVLASATLGLPFALTATVRCRYLTRTFVTEGAYTPAYALLDARVGYVLARSLEVYAGGLNLLSERGDPHVFSDDRPARGVVGYLGLESRFPREEPSQ